MKIALPLPKALALPPAWEAWVLRALFLCLLWGGGLFLWGSAAAYLAYQATRAEQQTLQQHLAQIEPWLTTYLEPMQKLAADKRLLMGLNLPGGLASAPVTRLLYEFSYAQRLPEVYIVDVTSKAINKTAGAGVLSTEVLQRLSQFSSSQPSILAVGVLRGNAYLVQPVPARLPQKVLLLVPLNLENWATAWPQPSSNNGENSENASASQQLGLLLPHTSGWAWWQARGRSFTLLANAPATFPLNGNFTPPQGQPLTITPLPSITAVAVGMPATPPHGTGWLSAASILLLLIGTAAILWKPTTAVRQKIQQQASHYAAPALHALAPIVLPLEALFAKAKAVGQNLTAATAEPALVSGPGAFDAADFQTGTPNRSGGKKTKPRFVPQATATSPETGSTPSDEQPDSQQTKTEEDAQKNLTKHVVQALENNRVSLLYQPIYRADDGKPVMHEVFARLTDDKSNIITPGQFLPITEELGLNPKLDAAVFRKVLNHHFAPGVVPATPLALNVAATSLDGINYLQELIRHGPSVLRHMAFEVRSQEVVRDATAIKLLKDLQANGGHLAVDYFGGGKTMLQASKSMGFNYVRFDAMRFATEAAQSELAQLCQEAKEVGLPVILERIENPQMEMFARQAGVSYLQGYGLAKPADKMTTEPRKPPR
ncbi:MAG: EAL domain-containing protein [Proteobacteria bacterium]|nr:EAL domain-containing protein [Pseudomonadota bacterium]